MLRIPILLVPVALAVAAQDLPVTISAGTPLRVALTAKTPLRGTGSVIRGRLAETVYVGERAALPAGSVVEGRMAEVREAGRARRVTSLLSGNFTPRPEARAQFDTVVLADGTRIPIRAAMVGGTPYPVTSSSKKKSFGGPSAAQQIGARLAAMLPVQRHSWPVGTRFLPVLDAPVAARGGAVTPTPGDGSEVAARLLAAVSSATAKQGDTVTAVVTRPVFGPDGKVLIPEGSRVVGEVVKARPAGYWHRNGRVHFVFRKIELPQQAGRTVQGYVEGVEAGFDANLAVNAEGATQVRSPKTRFVFPALAVAVAGASLHQDYNAQGVADQDIVGRAESGAVGFGLIGTAVAQISRNVASGFAFAGAAYGVYTTFLGRGQETVLPAHTPLQLSLKERGAAKGR